MLTEKHLEDFISRHRLPDDFHSLIREHYAPLTQWLITKHRKKKTLLIGISGAQGTGKSTLADYLQCSLTYNEKWHVAVLSIDDFYLTRVERKTLSETVHPLLLTRGVPGTHDLDLLTDYIARLGNLAADAALALPRFDKARDDRAANDLWPVVSGPIDLIILEGWCIGSRPQAPGELQQPINELERDKDPEGDWRRCVNRQLEGGYADLFAELDGLVYLQAPDFDSVFRWRLEQEEKLAMISGNKNSRIMDRKQLATFIQHFERLTRANMETLPGVADVVLELDSGHNCTRSIFR